MKTPSRTLTTVAIGALLLDAALLAYGGVLLGRFALLVAAAVCAALALLVALGWRRYRRTVAEISAARRDMRREVEAIRELLQRHHLNN